MGPPSQLAIATGVVTRLVKEEKSYHQEAEGQRARIAKLEQSDGGGDENHEFTLRQEVSKFLTDCGWNVFGFAIYLICFAATLSELTVSAEESSGGD